MKNTNKLIRSAAVLCALLIMTVSGCSNGNDIKSKNDFQEKSYSVSGSINLLDTNDRSATTSFTRLDSLNYSVVAYKGTSTSYEENSAVTASLGGSASDITYSLKLPEAGNWYIVASAKLSIEDEFFVDILTGSKEVDVPDQMAAYNVDAITLNLTGFTENASGSIDLVIYDHTNEVSKVDISAKALISKNSVLSQRKITNSGLTFTGTYEPGLTERTLTLEYEDISSDCYEIVFNFRDSNNKIIYSCKEAVTVLGGFVTDKWLQGSSGTGAHLVYDSYNNSTKFIITDELLNSYNQAGDFSNPIVLWSNKATEYIPDEYGQNVDGESGVLTSEYDTYQTGTQVFTKTYNNMTIFNPSCQTSSPAFCFDDQVPTSVYVLNTDDKTLYKFSPSYAAYKQSSFNEDYDEVDLSEIIAPTLENDIVLSSIYPSIAYYGGYIFFFYLTRNESWTQFSDYLGVIDVANPDNFLYCPTNDSSGITSMAIDSVEINGEDKLILCYSYFSNSNSCDMILSKAIALETNSLSFDDSVDRMETLSNANLGLNFLDNEIYASVTDMLIWENTLYIALAAYSSVKTKHPNKYIYDDGYINKAILVSNGGIAKIDLTNPDSYSLGEWDGSNSKVLGWFTSTVYNDSNGTNPTENVTMSPSPDNDAVYFYGPRKFIARKPDELVIADDGGYVDIDTNTNGDITAINDAACKNRIVTVDLKDESITAADVDVSFDVTFESWNYEPADTYTGYGFTNF